MGKNAGGGIGWADTHGACKLPNLEPYIRSQPPRYIYACESAAEEAFLRLLS